MLSTRTIYLGRSSRLYRLNTCHVRLRYNTTLCGTDPPVQPKRPSPYRLLSPITFLSAFAPLHVSGWRLLSLPSKSSSTTVKDIDEAHGDLQDRRLVRVYGFEDYGTAIKLLNDAKTAIEEEDVSVAVSEYSDVIPASSNDTHIPFERLYTCYL
jgi:hypothetical protein